MNCLDCAIEGDIATPAIGICHSCGAGVCMECARLDTHVIGSTASPGRSDRHETRWITCARCADIITTIRPLAFHGEGAISAAGR
jgi:hypothetical protein